MKVAWDEFGAGTRRLLDSRHDESSKTNRTSAGARGLEMKSAQNQYENDHISWN
jgi:hypothetical protein